MKVMSSTDRTTIANGRAYTAVAGVPQVVPDFDGAILTANGWVKVDFADSENEVATGSINGVNTTFVLANAPSPATSLKVFLNGQLQTVTTDYTLSGSTVTMVNAPLTGDKLVFSYKF